jgi:hypothetical protein
MSLNNATDWQFPVGDKQYSLSKLFTALAEAQSGYYLLGKNQQWHGGYSCRCSGTKPVATDR